MGCGADVMLRRTLSSLRLLLHVEVIAMRGTMLQRAQHPDVQVY